MLDEYGSRGWGETDAVDEFLKDKKLKITTIENSQKTLQPVLKSLKIMKKNRKKKFLFLIKFMMKL